MSTLRTQAPKDGERLAEPPAGYDVDFHLWTVMQAKALSEGRWQALDIAHLVEEVEGLGKSVRREIRSRLIVLLQHLLKWQFQPARRSPSWRATIREQRREIAQELRESPSLARYPQECLADQYDIARLRAAGETELPEETFPVACPFTIEQVLDEAFHPEAV